MMQIIAVVMTVDVAWNSAGTDYGHFWNCAAALNFLKRPFLAVVAQSDEVQKSDEWFLCMVGELQISFEFAVMSVRSAISNDAHRTSCDVRYGAKIRTKKLNDKRAFGGCLGTRRRRRTWHAAKSLGEPRAGFDPRISEWGNPSARRSSSEYIG